MLGAVCFVLLSDAFVDRAKLHAQTMPHGQVPRTPGLRQLQQPDSVPDSDLCPLQDDDDKVKLYGASNGLNACEDVVAGGQCSSFMRMCPLSCGVCDGTANLTALCHCFEFGWSLESECRWDASTLLPYAKLQCGADWYDSRATDIATINSVMAGWDASYTLSYGLSMGAYFTGDAAKFFRIFKEQHPMGGLLLIRLSAEDFRNMGFSVREANDMFNGLDDFNFKSYRGAPVDTYATYAAQLLELCARDPRPRLLSMRAPPLSSRYEPPGPMWDSTAMGFTRSKVEQHPIEMSVSIVLEALNSLDEVNFAFEVQFLLVASWKDERINTVCNGAGASGHPIPATDRCAHYWTPQLPPVFPNQVSIDGNMAIEVLEDLGLFTVPGRYRKECNSPEVDCSSPINTSMAYRMMRLRGSFGVTTIRTRDPLIRRPADSASASCCARQRWSFADSPLTGRPWSLSFGPQPTCRGTPLCFCRRQKLTHPFSSSRTNRLGKTPMGRMSLGAGAWCTWPLRSGACSRTRQLGTLTALIRATAGMRRTTHSLL